jgi:hypothetical protein
MLQKKSTVSVVLTVLLPCLRAAPHWAAPRLLRTPPAQSDTAVEILPRIFCTLGHQQAAELGQLGNPASRFADPAAQEAMAYVQRTLREELETTHTDRQ